MTRLQKIAMIVMALMVAVCSAYLYTIEASALTTAPEQKSQTGHGSWNWPKIIQTNIGTNNGGGACSGSCGSLPVTSFNPETSSYVIYHGSGTDWLVPYNPFGVKSVYESAWVVVIAPSGHQLVMKKDLSTGDYLVGIDSGSFYVVSMRDFNGEDANSNYYGQVLSASSGVTSSGNIQYIKTAHNVTYSGSWDAGVFQSTPDYGASVGQTCSAVDIGCWLGKTWNNVSDTISGVGKAIVSSITNLFAPDTAQIQSDFNSFKAFLDAKLGFLTYPFTFLVDVFNAFTGAGNMTCTTSGCVKSFGGFFGGSFFIDFAIVAEEMPTLWSYLCALAIGLTILEVIIMIRRKVMGIIHK